MSHIPTPNTVGKIAKVKVAIVTIVSILLLIVLALFVVYRVAVSKIYDDSIEIVERTEEPETYEPIDWENYEEETDEVVDIVNEVEMEYVPIYETVPIENEVYNVLVVGSDSRDPDRDRGRSDTMMLLSLNRKTNTASLVSFLRDTLVPIEGHGYSRLNHAYSWGGVGLMVNTINDNFGLDIQNYLLLNFDNLEKIVDDLGGVTVDISSAEVDYYNRNNIMSLSIGRNTLSGEQALKHARNRYLDSDFGRTRRQRDIMMGVYSNVMDTKSLSALTTVVTAILDQVSTNIEPNEIFTLAQEIWGADDLEIKQMAVPADGTWSFQSYKGMSIIQLDIPANQRILQDFLYGDTE